MRKSLGTLLALCFLAASPAFADVVSREIRINPSDLRITETLDGVRITLPGSTGPEGVGEPDLPQLPVHLLLPEGHRAVEIRVIPLETLEIAVTGSPAPAPELRPGPGTVGVLSGAATASLNWYPAEPLQAWHQGRMRGTGVTSVAVSPVQWLPMANQYRVHTLLRVEVVTEPAVREGDLRIERESRAGRESFGQMLRELTGDASGITATAAANHPSPVNSGEPFAPTFRPSLDGSPVEMIIICDVTQETEYQRLADFHTQTGLSAVVRTVDWIRNSYDGGVDLQETIRFFIQDAASKWGTAFVLLGGDTDYVPVRYGYTNFYGGENIPTDLYYTDLDGTWNADGDSRFGEGWGDINNQGDDVDLFPDVWVGRFPSNSLAEAQGMVDKTLTYGETPPTNGYQNEYLFLGEVLFPQEYNPSLTILLDGADLCEDAIDSLLGHHNPVRLYENYPGWPGSIPEDKATAVDSINAGFHLVHHVGHGFVNVMEVGINGSNIKNPDVDLFTNGDETFLLYAINCTSGAVDFNCLAERFMLNPVGGAVTVVGSTRLDFPTTGQLYQDTFYSLLLHNGVTQVGRAMAESKLPGIAFSTSDNSHRWTQFTQIMLGDPALRFWTDAPAAMAVTHGASHTLGSATFAVDVTSGGSPLAGATVALFKDGDAYTVGQTDGAGHVDLPFHPDLPGAFTVGVSAHDHIPYRGAATAAAPGGAPHVFAEDQEIDDDASGSSVGNGDGKLDAGETVELGFTLKNSGGVSETAITATLSTTDPYVSISDNLAFYPDIAPGASVSPSDRFLISISPDAPERHEAMVTLDVFGAVGIHGDDIILYLHAPIMEYRAQALRDSVGNGNSNGTIEVNEDFAILATLRNIGVGAAENVELRLRSSDPAVTITDSVTVLGDIAAGATASNPADGLHVRLSNLSEYHELRIVAVDAFGEIMSRLVELNLPGQVTNPVAFGSSTSIALTWDVLSDSTLWGYNVYRANSQVGPYARINQLTTTGTAFYNDDLLPGLTRFYYKIAALDQSGNEGPLSVAFSGTTSLPLHAEWPVEVASATTGGITLADLDGDDILEIVTAGEEIYAMHPDGSEFANGDHDVRTLGPIANLGAPLFWNTPAVGDIDGDGVVELAAVGWTDRNVHVVDVNGDPQPGWPKFADPNGITQPNPLGAVCFADIDLDGRMEVFCVVGAMVFGWRWDGTEIVDGDSNPATDGVFALTGSAFSYGTPTVANIDGEANREIIVGMRDGKLYVFEHDGSDYPGFPLNLGGDITGSVAVGDIDLDGVVEMVIGSGNSQLHAIKPNGTEATGFPAGIQLQEDVDSSPALGDLSGDGKPDVVIGASNGAVFAFSGANGSTLPGFPVLIRDNLNSPVPVRSSPVLADVDNDGSIDFVVGDQLGRLHGFDATGQPLPGFPIQTGNLIENAPVIWDVDNDGLTEIMVQSFDQNTYLWDTPWTFNQTLAVWPMFKRNQRNTGVLDESIFAVTGTPDTRVALTAVLQQNFPNPMRGATTMIQYRIPEGEDFRGVDLRVFDLRGRLVRTLVTGEQPVGVHEVRWDGRDAKGRTVAAGVYPYRLEVAGQVLTRKMVILR